MESRLRVLLDLDEVLVDFIGGACRAWRTNREAILPHWEPGKWDMVPPLAKALGKEISQDDFWTNLNGSEEFWLGLDWLPWSDELLRLTKQLTDDWWIITAPSRCGSSYTGKLKFIKRRFGKHFDRFVITPHKELMAQPGVVLIDDRDSNVEKFVKSRGSALVFPTHHNSLHPWKDRPMDYIAPTLELLVDGVKNGDWSEVWRGLGERYRERSERDVGLR